VAKEVVVQIEARLLADNRIFQTKYKADLQESVHKLNDIATEPMLSVSLVTMAGRVLRLRMEEMASRYGG
jgi:hypothetical protein